MKPGRFLRLAPAAALAVVLTACTAPAQTPTAQPAVPTMALQAPEAEATTISAPAGQPPAQPAIDLGVTGSGAVQALQTADLSFQIPGVVGEVMVEEGAEVREGQVLASLVLTDIQLQVQQAEAGLAAARANFERLLEGATPAEERAARAQLAQAQAGLRQARGSVTDADIRAAEAQLEQARALLARLESGPKTTDVQQAQAALDQARANLSLQRDNLSAQKTSAELAVEQAANVLRDAQANYSNIYWRNRQLEDQLGRFGQELPQEARDREDAALRAVQNAEAQLEQARVRMEQARQAEVDGVAAAEAQVSQAQAAFDRLLAGAEADQRAAARAQVAAAEATRSRLRRDQRAGALQAAEAAVAGAQANVERATADPSEATLAAAQAQIAQAEVAVSLAKRNLEKASIIAPFDGVVSLVNIDPGDPAGAGPLAIQLVDVSKLRVEVNISDTDIARVRLGQRAEVRLDALPEIAFSGTVSYVAPVALTLGNVRTFPVRIDLETQDGLRAGMSARVTITP